MKDKAFDYISKMPHFSFLPQKELIRVADAAVFETIKAGKQIATKGESKVDSIYIITKGSLALYDLLEGERKLTGHIKPGDVFGGITILLNGGISLRTVVVENDCTGFKIPEAIFQDLCAKYKNFYEYFLENFSRNIFDPSLSALIETGQTRLFLEGIEPFSFLPEEELDQVAADLTIAQHPKNTVLFVQGRSRVGYLYIVQRGSAERYFEQNQKRALRELLNEGDIYGGISMLLNDGISVRTVKTLEKTFFYMLPKKRFLEICRHYESFTEYFTDSFGRRMLEKSYAAVIAKTMAPKEHGLQFFNQHVASVYTSKPIFGDTRMTIQQVAQTMAREKISSMFINNADMECVGLEPNTQCVGVVTERDLTHRVIAKGYDIQRSVKEIMSAPLRTIPEYALIFEALMSMMENNIRHLGVTDVNDKVVGILTNRDLLAAQGQSPLFLIRRISKATTLEEVIDSHERLPHIIRTLITGGAKADNITRFITTITDAILQKIMAFTLKELGDPPCRFVFMTLGSEGRSEQTLKTDQDNAIVYEDVAEKDAAEVKRYFIKFGEMACTLLDRAGYAFCTGGVMAKNPNWCQPITTWKNYFTRWIHAAQPEDLLQASIFFDFRTGYGDNDLVEQLRRHLFESLRGWVGFFRHLTENALHFKPPLGFFRSFVVESKGEHRDKFDIKSAMTPIVDFARIYALHNEMDETNTLQRLAHLRLKEVLSAQESEELEKAYSFLLQLRFVRQITAVIDEKAPPDNYINPKKLTRIEQKMLKEIFLRVEKFQSKMEFDFIGIM